MEQSDYRRICCCCNHHLSDGKKRLQKKGIYPDCLIPGSFYYVHYILLSILSQIGFSLPMTVAYIIAGILTALYFAGLIMLAKSMLQTMKKNRILFQNLFFVSYINRSFCAIIIY